MRTGAFALSLLLLLAPAIAPAETTAPPENIAAGRLGGKVAQPLALDEALLRSLPVQTLDITFETGKGPVFGHYTGVLLWALLQKAEPVDDPGKNSGLKHTLLVTGRDGYSVALAFGEIDPDYEAKRVIVAYAGGDPPASFAALRLVVPGDKHGGRSVRDVVSIEIR